MTIREIADKFGVTFYQIQAQMVKHEITRRHQPSEDACKRTRPYINRYFLQKIDGFYYPLKGGDEMIPTFEEAMAAAREDADDRTAEELTTETIEQDVVQELADDVIEDKLS